MPRRPVRVGKYDIVAKIAKGGMGAVFKAKHPTLNRFVILKQLTLKGGSGFIERFKREASLMLDFRDERIVQVYDHFKEGSSYYIAMEYVDGTSLDKLISGRRSLSNEAALLILSEICKALKYAHDKGVIHRDIKPANILISKEGVVKLTDFGIATTKEADDEGLTKVGMTLGTPAYMSPEQISDTRKVDKRADIYSLGVVFYEMITGTKPFPSSFTPETIHYINRGIYVKPQKINPAIPGIYKRIIKKTMNRKIGRRFRDLGELLEILSRHTRKYKDQQAVNGDIAKYLTGEEVSFPTLFLFGGKSLRRRGYRLALAVSLVLCGAVALGGLAGWLRGTWYERFRNREYGSIEISVAVPPKYHKETEDIYAHAVLTPSFKEEEGPQAVYRYKLLPAEQNLLSHIQSFPSQLRKEKRPQKNLLTTAVRYLPAGEYTLDLYVESDKIRKVFYLNPRVVQRLDVRTSGRESVQVTLEDPQPKPVSVYHRVADSRTGASILNIADISFFLEEQKTWVDWKRHVETPRFKELVSGKKYTFRYAAPLYYPKTVRVFVDRDVDSAVVDVSLVKEPGSLAIASDTAGLSLLLDNRKESYLGINRKEFVVFGNTLKGTREFALPEGVYVLTVKKDGRLLQNQQFSVRAGRTTELAVSYDSRGKTIRIQQKNKQE